MNDSFKKWFGNSAVVDSSGNPLVVYHGTDSLFHVFDENIGRKWANKFGFFFTIDRDFAEMYGEEIMPVYLSLSNPKKISYDKFDGYRMKHHDDNEWWNSLRKDIEEDGHDGIIINQKTEKFGELEVKSGGFYIAFRPNQIKLAIGNNGNYDPNNPNITMKDGGNTDKKLNKGGELIWTDLSDGTQSRKSWESRKSTNGQDSFGAFAHRDNKKHIGDYYLYRLDDFDEDFYSHIPLRKGEILARVQTDKMVGGEMPLVKINIDKGWVYFMTDDADDKTPQFDTRTADVVYLSLDKAIQKYSERKTKLYKGGEVENYNKWKEVDWDSFAFQPKERSKIYRLIGWYFSDRIDWNKMPKKDKEYFIDDVIDELEREDTLGYLFRDEIKELEDAHETLMEHEDLEDIEDVKKLNKEIDRLLNSDEFKDFKAKLDKYGLTEKDIATKSEDEILKKITEGKDVEWITDYVLLNDDNWYNHNDLFNDDHLPKLYDKLLERGAVFTEEAEAQQYDMFEDVKENPKEEPKQAEEVVYIEYLNKDKGHKKDMKFFNSYSEAEKWAKKELGSFNPDMIHYSTKEEKEKIEEFDATMAYSESLKDKEDLANEVELQIEFLEELLHDIKGSKDENLTEEIELQLEFLRDIKEENYKSGGIIKESDEIIVIFDDNIYPQHMEIFKKYQKGNIEKIDRIGYANVDIYLEDMNTLYISELNIFGDNKESDIKAVSKAIEDKVVKETRKTRIKIN